MEIFICPQQTCSNPLEAISRDLKVDIGGISSPRKIIVVEFEKHVQTSKEAQKQCPRGQMVFLHLKEDPREASCWSDAISIKHLIQPNDLGKRSKNALFSSFGVSNEL